MPFGQLVVGPPGSGKSTYCHGMQQLMSAIKRQPCYIVNLDPANDRLPYDCAVDVFELVRLRDVMEQEGLGVFLHGGGPRHPNGGLIHCMEVLERNYQWLANKICALDRWQDAYFVFDCPGQVELFTNHTALPNVLRRLTAAREATVASDTASSATTAGTSSPLDLRLCCVHLVDSFHCADASRFISVVLLSLQTMLHLELPHVNVLSKMDLMESRGPLAFSLDFYTGVMNLDYLLEQLNGDTTGQDDEGSPSHAKARRFHKLNAALCELIDDFSLVSFHPLCIEDQRSTLGVLRAVDKANGYVFGGLDEANEAIMGVAVRGDRAVEDVTYAQERFLSRGVRERVDGDMSTLREYGCDDDECGESSVHCASVPR